MTREKIVIDGRTYRIEVRRQKQTAPDVVRILMPTFMPTLAAIEVTRVCIESVLQNTIDPYELWIIDNNSPRKNTEWLKKYPNVNLVFNRTTPLSPSRRLSLRHFLKRLKRGFKSTFQVTDGAYANAIGLEIAARLIDQSTKLVFTMHNDILVLKEDWLSFLKAKINNKVKAVSCWTDKSRVQALHVAGLLFDFQCFLAGQANFFPNIGFERSKKYPEYDVGDFITVKFKEIGYQVYACRNTYNSPELVDQISESNPIKDVFSIRCFDDAGEIFYAHMGRGIPKAMNNYFLKGKTYPEQWVNFAETYILKNRSSSSFHKN